MATIAIAVTIALLFYLVLPLLGAFSVRKRWRVFRKQMVQGSTNSRLTYSNPATAQEGYAGRYRFIGKLEAIQNDSDIWVNNGEISVKAELTGVDIYLLPASRSMEAEDRIEKNEELLPEDVPGKLNWDQVYSLAQGTGFFLSGSVYIENGNPVFRKDGEGPLLIIIYDGSEESILRRSIWCGRHKNEYWNPITPVSLLAGSFFLFVIAFLIFRQPEVRALSFFIAVMSFIPLIPFLPPGVVFYFIYRKLWKSGRMLRGERDLLRLPLRNLNSVVKKENSCEKALAKYPGAKLRGSGTIRNAELLHSECFVFTPPNDSNDMKPDPLFEELIIPGDPEILALNSRRKARRMELAAAFMFVLGFVINTLIIFQLILWFI